MGKLIRLGRVVVLTKGRYAGKKAIVVGISKSPGIVKQGMPTWKVTEKSKVNTFLKVVNVCHIVPTRYSVEKEINVKGLVPDNIDMSDASAKKATCDKISKDFMSKFVAKNNQNVGF